jgi:repressor LexA
MMARKRKAGLTEPQIKVLEVLDRFQRKSGYPPSIREIKDKAQLSSTSVVNYYLDQLEEMGYIERDQHVSRGIRLVKSLAEIIPSAASKVQKAIADTLSVPVIGRIFASEPVPVPASNFSYMDYENTVDVALSMLPERETDKLYALEVRGDSMIDAMVYEGDIVIMKPTKDVRNGDMVAIWLNDKDETTLKYFYLENGRVRLQPANPTMNAIYIDNPETVEVQGKVVMVIRPMKEGLRQ